MSSKSEGVGSGVDPDTIDWSRSCRTPECDREATREIEVQEDGMHFAVSVCKPCQISHATGKRYERYRGDFNESE